jgi:methionine synthase II (cobalamin-independent)
MKTSTGRILTTHVGSIPRPESVTALLRARVSGQSIEHQHPIVMWAKFEALAQGARLASARLWRS